LSAVRSPVGRFRFTTAEGKYELRASAARMLGNRVRPIRARSNGWLDSEAGSKTAYRRTIAM
jgi:hypothetical protein